MKKSRLLSLLIAVVCHAPAARAQELSRLKYNHSGLTVDLGVGLWAFPLPMDFDGDGVPDFLGGAEDGRFCLLKNPRAK